MAEHFRHIAQAFFMCQNGSAALESKVPERAVPMKGARNRVWGRERRRASESDRLARGHGTGGRRQVDRHLNGLGAQHGRQLREIERIGEAGIRQCYVLLREDRREPLQNHGQGVPAQAAQKLAVLQPV